MKTLMMNLAGFALLTCLFSTYAHAQTNKPIELVFVDHLKAGLIEQDAFVEKVPGTGQVYRLTPEEREKYLDSEVYATREMQHHNPFDKAEAGPYQRGESLGMTLREWLTGTGKATYICEDGWGVLKAEFQNLVPNATYTMWHFFMAKPPTDPFIGTFDLPVGDRDGSQSVFVTDENGKATVERRFDTCLQLTDEQLMAGLAIAYHSDGKTYGVLPGPFGRVTHVQLFCMLPDADDLVK